MIESAINKSWGEVVLNAERLELKLGEFALNLELIASVESKKTKACHFTSE